MNTKKPFNFDRRNRRNWIILAAAGILPMAGLQAQNSTADDRPAVPRPLAQNDQARAAAERLQGALPEEGKDRDDLIKAAQDRLKKLKGEPTTPATITDQNRNGETTNRARPVEAGAKPEEPKPAAKPLPNATTTGTPPAPKPVSAGPESRPPVPPPVPLAVGGGDIPPPAPLRPRYDKPQNDPGSGEAMIITAHESVMDEKNNKATFKGDVIVNHPTFVMKSEYLVVYMNDKENPQMGPDGTEPPFKKAIATGPMVEIEQTVVEGGKTVVQIAKSRQAEFDGITGDTILTGGPPFLQKGKQIIRPQKESAKIILKSNGEHRVEGRNTVKFQIKGGKAASGPGLPGGTLDSITNKKDR